MTPGLFSRQQVTAITGLSSRQLSYWRKTGLVVPQDYTAGGHARYSFSDLIALRTAKRLLDAKISLQRIRTCLQSLTRFLPTADRPLVELSLVVTGDVVLVFHGQRAFDALTGQQWVFPPNWLRMLRRCDSNDRNRVICFPRTTRRPAKGAWPDNSNTGMLQTDCGETGKTGHERHCYCKADGD